MKDLRDFLFEQLNEGKATETVVKDKDGNEVIIIGKPFTTDRDERYLMAKEYIKQNHLKVDIDLKDAIKANGENDVEAWVFVKEPKSVHVVDADLLDIPEELFEGKQVYAIVDFTGAIQGVFDNEEDAKKAAADLPKESEAKVQKMDKSEVEK